MPSRAAQLAALLQGRQTATGWSCRCPAHDDAHASLSLTDSAAGKLLYHCHAGCAQEAVKEAILTRMGGRKPAPPPTAAPKHKPNYKTTARYDYTDDKGQLIFQVRRHEATLADGTIDKTFSQHRPDGDGWIASLKDYPAAVGLVYHLPRIRANPENTVFVVEGEKDVHSLEALGFVATTNAGGAANWKPEHSEYLRGRNVVVLVDNDDPGIKAGETRAASIARVAHRVRVLPPFKGPLHFDVSDWLAAGHDRKELVQLCKATPDWSPRLLQPPAEPEIPLPDEPPPEPPELPPGEPTGDPDVPELESNVYPLGTDGDDGYYFHAPLCGGRVVRLSASALMSPSGLTKLADLAYWTTRYPSRNGAITGPGAQQAGNAMMRSAEAVGEFLPSRVRGRGIWMDHGRVIVHAGDRLIVNGEPCEMRLAKSKFVYEKMSPLQVAPVRSLTPAEGQDLFSVIQMLPWKHQMAASLFLGWIVSAMCGGLLRWRPHLWISGLAGTGKSWIVQQVLWPLLGQWAIHPQGNSTAAGVRQQMRSDALAVIWDEFDRESDNPQALAKQDDILALIRQSSTNSGRQMLGTTVHRARWFDLYGSYCLSSVSVPLRHAADLRRITPLEIERPPDRSIFANHIVPNVKRLLTADFNRRFRWTVIEQARHLRRNTELYHQSLKPVTSNDAEADQFAAMLAGCHAVYYGGDATTKQLDISRLMGNEPEHRITDDEQAREVIRVLWEAPLQADSNGRRYTRTVGELLMLQKDSGYEPDGGISEIALPDAKRTLHRAGFKLNGEGVYISRNASSIATILKGTPFHRAWGRHLLRVPGSQDAGFIEFLASRWRAVWVPWGQFGKGGE